MLPTSEQLQHGEELSEVVIETSVWQMQSLRVQRPHCARYAFTANALRCEQCEPLQSSSKFVGECVPPKKA
jgi:hypothetical protein